MLFFDLAKEFDRQRRLKWFIFKNDTLTLCKFYNSLFSYYLDLIFHRTRMWFSLWSNLNTLLLSKGITSKKLFFGSSERWIFLNVIYEISLFTYHFFLKNRVVLHWIILHSVPSLNKISRMVLKKMEFRFPLSHFTCLVCLPFCKDNGRLFNQHQPCSCLCKLT